MKILVSTLFEQIINNFIAVANYQVHFGVIIQAAYNKWRYAGDILIGKNPPGFIKNANLFWLTENYSEVVFSIVACKEYRGNSYFFWKFIFDNYFFKPVKSS